MSNIPNVHVAPERHRWRKKMLVVLPAFLLFCLGMVALVWTGLFLPNGWRAAQYPVRGVDVSSWQGDIDWPVLAAQDIAFVFIKATEGSTLTDTRFAENWQGARQTDLLVGAYHFFSFDSPGATQAEHFLRTAPAEAGALPPVVDVEFYGEHAKNPPPAEDVQRELQTLLDLLEEACGKMPILYATEESHALYLREGFAEYPLWIRSVLLPPGLPDGGTWTFWQYSNRGRLIGFQGKETFIDLNVYDGTIEDLYAMCMP